MRHDQQIGALQTNKDIKTLNLGKSAKLPLNRIKSENKSREQLAREYIFLKNRRDSVESINEMFGEEIIDVEEEFHRALSILESPRGSSIINDSKSESLFKKSTTTLSLAGD